MTLNCLDSEGTEAKFQVNTKGANAESLDCNISCQTNSPEGTEALLLKAAVMAA